MPARRDQGSSLESSFSVSLPEAANRAEELVRVLEQQLSVGDDPIARLSRNFSIHSTISTASSFAQQQQQACLQENVHEFREIGAGYCGTVFERHGAISVLKKAKYGQLTLWNDYCIQAHVYDQFAIARPLFHNQEVPRIPRPVYFTNPEDDQEWWTENGGKFPPSHRTPQTPVLCLERIFPLPKPIREDLIDLFCPEAGRAGAKKAAGNKDCIIRLYLGRRRRNTSRPVEFFSLRNFSLHLDMAEQIRLDVAALADQMAIGLALCHWQAKVDCNDVEFVIGSAPTILNFAVSSQQVASMPMNSTTRPEGLYDNFKKRATHLWMLDYDKCHTMPMTDDGIAQAVRAAEDNDPYFPKPHKTHPTDQKLWETFSQAYIKASKTILDANDINTGLKDGPKKFIRGWETYRMSKLEKEADVEN
ncbi:hypothetical protein MMC16_003006 [Acarospora aff. strigata]|nr:hypothetical protein [Acarospora aff. strigata]